MKMNEGVVFIAVTVLAVGADVLWCVATNPTTFEAIAFGAMTGAAAFVLGIIAISITNGRF